MAQVVGEPEVDAAAEFNRANWYIRVRTTHMRRLVWALRLLYVTVWIMRRMGVGVRVCSGKYNERATTES